ncbi:MAG: alpha/beta hydrolase [Roseiflexaceae bacterium]|nr:alpha/beta hydrolase [Roseiflexaceae bacterium]
MNDWVHLRLTLATCMIIVSGCAASRETHANTAPSAAADCQGTGTTAHRDLAYTNIAGVDPNLLALDLYTPLRPANCAPAPIVVYVHGGGFRGGDKANQIADKIPLFNKEGWLFASVNYRLSPASPSTDPNRVMYPIHEQDVATALGWLHTNAAQYGGDPNRILLLGHSAGALLVAAVATDEGFVNAAGLDMAAIRCAAPLDTEGYDVAAVMTEDDQQAAIYRNAFGDDPAVWADASPINQIAPGKRIPDFLLVTRGQQSRIEITQRFASLLNAGGVPASVLLANPLSHEEVNAAVGKPGDTIVTPALMAFFRSCVAEANAVQTRSYLPFAQ